MALNHEHSLGTFDEMPITTALSDELRVPAENLTAAPSRGLFNAAAEEEKEEVKNVVGGAGGGGKKRGDHDMGEVRRLGGRENVCDEACTFGHGSEIDAEPASSQDQFHRAIRTPPTTDPTVTSLSFTLALLESHKIEARRAIEPMPISGSSFVASDNDSDGSDELRPPPVRSSKRDADSMSCSGTGSTYRSHIGPGAFAVRVIRSTEINSTAAGADTAASSTSPAAFLDVDTSRGATNSVVERDEENVQNLAVANALHSSLSSLPLADPLDSKDIVSPEQHPKWRGYLMVFIFSVAVLALAGSLLLINQKETNSNHTSPVETNPPTSSLVPSITFENALVELLPDYTRSAIAEEGSPQARAFLWLLDDPNVSSYPEWRLLQRLSLATLYFATDGFNWANSTNWLSYDDHECTWHSSTIHKNIYEDSTLNYTREIWMEDLKKNLCPCCGASNSSSSVGAYKNLRLISNSLHGTFPMELYLLTSLESLAFMLNSVEGTISSHLGMLSELQSLNLVSMELEGSLPTEIGLLTNLKTLILYTNRLSGQIPSEIGLLQALQELYLEENNFTNTIPTEIGLLANLLHMYLDTNSALTGTIPTELGLLSSVRDFQIFMTSIGGNIPSELGRLPSLTQLDLGENQLVGQIPPDFSNLSSLELLALSGNALSGTVMTQLALCRNLLFLVLRDNKLTGEIASELGLLTKLKSLSIGNNKMQGGIPMEIMKLTQLTNLRLGRNNFTGHIPSEVGLFLCMKSFFAESNSFTGQIPSEIGQWINLTSINLSDNDLRGSVPREVASLPLTTRGLELFNISNNPHLTGTLPNALCKASEELTILYDCTDVLCGCACSCVHATNETDRGILP